MNNKTPEEAIQTIRKNWPDEKYTMLREALEYAITAIEENERLKEIDERECLIAISLKKERDEWLRKAGENGKFYMDALKEVEQLKADKAALLECMKFYGDEFTYEILDAGYGPMIKDDRGWRARECLAQIGGTQ